MADKRDYYEVLGVSKNATDDEIKRAYRKKAKECHPDLHPDDKEAEGRFKELNEANEVLSDPQKRARYDQYGFEDPMAGMGGAMKNIIALAAGISTGLGYGDNAKAAIITRGMAEVTRLGLKMGCQESTFSGLAGIGDLVVTATSVHSRNNKAGNLLGKGYAPEEAIKEVGMVVEGINAIPAAMKLLERYQVEMPIIEAVNAIVNQGANPKDVVQGLMGRDKKLEAGEA